MPEPIYPFSTRDILEYLFDLLDPENQITGPNKSKMTRLSSELAKLTSLIEDKTLENIVKDLRDKLSKPPSSLSRAESKCSDALKPIETGTAELSNQQITFQMTRENIKQLHDNYLKEPSKNLQPANLETQLNILKHNLSSYEEKRQTLLTAVKSIVKIIKAQYEQNAAQQPSQGTTANKPNLGDEKYSKKSQPSSHS